MGLRAPGALATLMLPGGQNVFGTAKMDRHQAGAGAFGEFIPASAAMKVCKKENASLLIPSLNVVLRVLLWPGEGGVGTSEIPFEYASCSQLKGGPAAGQN